MQKFTIELYVSDTWVADGFTCEPEAVKDAIISKCIPYAYEGEVRVRVTPSGKVDKAPEDAI